MTSPSAPPAEAIARGDTALGIELGSTRIKAVLTGPDHAVIATGGHDWENEFTPDRIWSYSVDAIWGGLQAAYADLAADVQARYGVTLTTIGAIGFSGMMHGYMPFDAAGELLVPFRTWRNTMTERAAAELTKSLRFNIPQRWSIAHLYEAILKKEKHVKEIAFFTTLAGYVHWKLTGQKVLGIGDASGMFPIDSEKNNFNAGMIKKFNSLIKDKNYPWKLEGILPKALAAGEDAGTLTSEGAKLLDPSGKLQAGIPLCPPEGDAGTGMAATNSVTERTGNVSAGTSIFAMIVLEKPLSKVYMEIDMVTTPAGKPVAMVHCGNCTPDLDAWVRLFEEVIGLSGGKISRAALYDALYFKALEGEADCGGVISYNYYAGEPITGLDEGRPLLVRMPDSKLSLANFMRNLLFSTMGTLKIGMEILVKEKVKLDSLLGHGGLFKTKGVGQRLMAAALNVPVAVMESAGEGGAWGIALLAAYRAAALAGKAPALESFLAKKVFAGNKGSKVSPDKKDIAGFDAYMKRYVAGLAAEKAAVEALR